MSDSSSSTGLRWGFRWSLLWILLLRLLWPVEYATTIVLRDVERGLSLWSLSPFFILFVQVGGNRQKLHDLGELEETEGLEPHQRATSVSVLPLDARSLLTSSSSITSRRFSTRASANSIFLPARRKCVEVRRGTLCQRLITERSILRSSWELVTRTISSPIESNSAYLSLSFPFNLASMLSKLLCSILCLLFIYILFSESSSFQIMADDLADDDYYLQEEIPSETKTTTTKQKSKKNVVKRARGTYGELLSTFRIFYKKSKSQYEVDELLSKFTANLAAASPSSPAIGLDQYLNELVSAKQWAKHADLPSAPVVLIVAQSALRCIELGKVLKNSSAAAKSFSFHFLFAKHKKLTEQVEHLRQAKTCFNLIIGTPKRLDDVLESEVINLKRLKFVLIDWNYENVKHQRLIDLNQLKCELCHLLCEKKSFAKRFAKEKSQLGLF